MSTDDPPVDDVVPDPASTPRRSSAPRGGSSGPRRVDESMTLLREVMERPLDPGYAAAAARRAAEPAGARRRRVPGTVLLGLVCGLLAVVGVLQLRAPAAEGRTASLREQVEQRRERVADLSASVLALSTSVRAAEQAGLGTGGDALAEQVEALGVLTGDVAVQGPGVRVVLDDAPAADPDASGSPRTAADAVGAQGSGRVRDRDLQLVVNGLWVAGAEAVSVDDHRLTARSAIRGAGEAVLVDFEPLSPPYEIEAVGDPGALQTEFARSAGGRFAAGLSQYGITVDVEEDSELELPASVLALAPQETVPDDAGGLGGQGAPEQVQGADP